MTINTAGDFGPSPSLASNLFWRGAGFPAGGGVSWNPLLGAPPPFPADGYGSLPFKTSGITIHGANPSSQADAHDAFLMARGSAADPLKPHSRPYAHGGRGDARRGFWGYIRDALAPWLFPFLSMADSSFFQDETDLLIRSLEEVDYRAALLLKTGDGKPRYHGKEGRRAFADEYFKGETFTAEVVASSLLSAVEMKGLEWDVTAPEKAAAKKSAAPDPGLLYSKYHDFAKKIAHSIFMKHSYLGSFGREELLDAALDGLLEACMLWAPDHASGAKFETYAFWFIKGRVLNRITQLNKHNSTADYEFYDEGKRRGDGGRVRPGYDEHSARRAEGYIEDTVIRMREERRILNAFEALQKEGSLSRFETEIGIQLFVRKMGLTDITDVFGYNLSKVRVTAAKLIHKIKAKLRHDVFTDFGSAPWREALQIVNEALAILSTEDPDFEKAKPLGEYKRFMPDMDELRRTSEAEQGGRNTLTEAASVISFYRSMAALRINDLAEDLEMNLPALYRMAHRGKLDSRRSISTILNLANTLGLDPLQILFRANPELQDFFDRVIYAGDDVYVAIVDVDAEPADIVARMSRTDGENRVHNFSEILKSYRLWSGHPSARDLGTDYVNIEQGLHASPGKLKEIALRINMPPLLVLLGTWPELLSLFDIVDSRGAVVHRGSQDYSRIVITLNRTGASRPELQAPPDTADLKEFVRHLVAGKGPVFTSDDLGRFDLSQRILSVVLGGTPCQSEHLLSLSRFFELDPFEEARLALLAIAAKNGTEAAPVAGEIAKAARLQSEQLKGVRSSGWKGMDDLVAESPTKTRELTENFLRANGLRHAALVERYLRDLGELWKIEAAGETATAPDSEGAEIPEPAQIPEPTQIPEPADVHQPADIRKPTDIHEIVGMSKDLRKQGSYEEAREILLRARRGHPREKLLLTELGLVALGQGVPDEAREHFLEALNGHPRDVVVLTGLGIVERKRGNFVQAKRYLLKALDEDDRNRSALDQLGWLALDRGNTREARARFLQVLRYHPGDKGALRGMREVEIENQEALDLDGIVERIQRLRKKRDLDAAGEDVLKALREYPEHPDLLTEMGLISIERKRYVEARAAFDLAYRTAPNSPNLLFAMSKLAMRQGNFDKAALLLNEAMKHDPQETSFKRWLGYVELKRGNTFEAEKWYTQVLRNEPNDSWALCHIAKINVMRGDLEKARGYLKRVRRSDDSDQYKLMTTMGELEMETGDYTAAKKWLLRAHRVVPKDTAILRLLGQLALHEKNHSEAAAYLGRAHELDNNDPAIMIALGKLALMEDEPRAAEDWFLRALELDENNGAALNQLGWLAMSRERPVEAETYFRRNAELNPDDKYAWTNLSYVYKQMQEYDKAAECYRKHLERRFDPPVIWHWFRMSAVSGDHNQFAWFIDLGLKRGNISDFERGELEAWDRRARTLRRKVSAGESAVDYLSEVRKELSPIYNGGRVENK